MKKVSEMFSVNIREGIKAVSVTVLGAIFTAVYKIWETGGAFPMTLAEWKTILGVGFGAGFTYIVATYFSDGKPSVLEGETQSE